MVQLKELITTEEYFDEFIPLKVKIAILKDNKPPKSKEKELEAWKTLLSKAKKEFSNRFPNEIFVVNSPLFRAISTGILVLPKIQGGCMTVKIEKYENN